MKLWEVISVFFPVEEKSRCRSTLFVNFTFLHRGLFLNFLNRKLLIGRALDSEVRLLLGAPASHVRMPGSESKRHSKSDCVGGSR